MPTKLNLLTDMTYPRHLPQQAVWYHGTAVDKAQDILDSGYLKSALGVYFANTLEGALNFGLERAQGTVAVFCVPTDTIVDLELSTDHDPEQYPEGLVCAVTDTKVPVEAHMIRLFKLKEAQE